jgi:hypothetical protein
MLAIALPLQVAAEAPPNRYQIVDGTVRDVRTNLTWQQAVDVHTFQDREAGSYCEKLDLAGGGWRLPTRAELLTLVDPSEQAPKLDKHAFPATPSTWFWTTTMFIDIAASAWAVNFEDGSSDYFGIERGLRVRCVR